MALKDRVPAKSGCRAKTGSGRPCGAPALRESQFCSLHADPDRASKLGRKSAAVRSSSEASEKSPAIAECPVPKTASDVKEILAQTMADIRAGKTNPKLGTTLAYIATALLRAIEVSDLENRLRGMEAALSRKPPTS
jgi:hypothetical protein